MVSRSARNVTKKTPKADYDSTRIAPHGFLLVHFSNLHNFILALRACCLDWGKKYNIHWPLRLFPGRTWAFFQALHLLLSPPILMLSFPCLQRVPRQWRGPRLRFCFALCLNLPAQLFLQGWTLFQNSSWSVRIQTQLWLGGRSAQVFNAECWQWLCLYISMAQIKSHK